MNTLRMDNGDFRDEVEIRECRVPRQILEHNPRWRVACGLRHRNSVTRGLPIAKRTRANRTATPDVSSGLVVESELRTRCQGPHDLFEGILRVFAVAAPVTFQVVR